MANVPNVFLPDTVINSAEVNENFDALFSTILSVAGVDSATWLKDFVIGKRSNMLISGAADTGSAPSMKFLQLGWNANFINLGSGVWKLARFNDGETATMIRIGSEGFEVKLTSRTEGNLDTQMNVGFAVRANNNGRDFIYIPGGWNIVQDETANPEHDELRMTVTFFNDPIVLTSKVATSKGSTSVNVFDNGVSSFAKGVIVNITALGSSVACLYRVYQERGSRDNTHGFVTRIPASAWGGAQGIVPLGRAGNEGKIVFDRSESLAQQTVVVIGYLS